jgi:hypothetical protein
MKTLGILTISLLFIFFSCKKESFITSPDARVTITEDSLKYDTVFVTAGSVYQFFKIINENNQKLRLTSVKLMGGINSVYKINVDGIAGPQVNDLEIEANDSLYVFVQVNINPNAGNLPFILRDSIQINYNGQNKLVQLEAWGQNAHFFRNKEITVNETWNNDLPYVILGSLLIDPGQTLTINKGCRIYVHADAPIVVDGSLQINGEKDTINRVYFRGDRLDDPYKDFPASWPGIFFRSTSKDNVFNYTVIKNAYQAIAAQDLPPNAPSRKITLNECIIDNAYDAGIITVNSSITARNCLVSNCGKNIVLTKGGDYLFTHCTVAYTNSYYIHEDSVLSVYDYDLSKPSVIVPLSATFRNCIFWGEDGRVSNEVGVYKKNSGNTVTFDNVLWKVQSIPAGAATLGNLINQNPLFDSINIGKHYYDFHLKLNPSSPAIDKGGNFGITSDLDGKPRPLGAAPDLGCFEKK